MNASPDMPTADMPTAADSPASLYFTDPVSRNPSPSVVFDESDLHVILSPSPPPLDALMCSICCQELGTCGMIIRCGHLFHEHCIMKWFRDGRLTCPMCRAHYTCQDLMDIMTTAQQHKMYVYEQLLNTLIPSVYIKSDNGELFVERDASCRCVLCRGPITDVFELFIGSSICRHFFHVSCATNYFLETKSTEQLNEQKKIEKLLVETDYCPYCIQELDANGMQRLERMHKIELCREHL